MTSKLKRGIVAGVCALGATIAGITPAHAAGLASYNCGTNGNPVTFTFTRTGPTGLAVQGSLSNVPLASPVGVGGAS